MAPTSQPSSPETAKRLHRVLSVLAGLAALAITGYLALMLHESQPDYYQPARTALVTAKQRFAVSYSEENDLLESLRQTHQDLTSVISKLDDAGVDPAYRADLEHLRARLQQLTDVQYLEQLSSPQLADEYSAIEAEFDALIAKLGRHQSE